MRPLCLGILPAIWTVARLATESPKISYTVSIPEPQTHLFHIELGIQGWSAPQIEVSMPVWSTGYYHVLDFAGQVEELEAFDDADKKPVGKKIDKNTRRFATRDTDRMTIRYVLSYRR